MLKQVTRPEWVDFHMGKAFYVSTRSHDTQTKCGCVIVNEANQPIGEGYNGFPRDMDDAELPTTRPEKYPLIIHSEVNAVSNCIISPRLIPGIKRAFITSMPCEGCMKHLWQNDVTEWYICKIGRAFMCDKKTDEFFEMFLRHINRKGERLKVHFCTPNLAFIKEWMLDMRQIGLFQSEVEQFGDKMHVVT